LAKNALIQYEQKKSQLSFLSKHSVQQVSLMQVEKQSISTEKYNNLIQKIHSYNPNDLTPIQALAILDDLQKNNPL
ncbi:MAG: hypothetical protein WD512_01095, partial [Candidatus Paceibacterota bacterium]